jgi:hypothetical protein
MSAPKTSDRRIITPDTDSLKPDLEEARLIAEYNNNAALKVFADKLHMHRMLPPPTCLDCIRRAKRMLLKI